VSGQLSIVYDPTYVGREAWQRQLVVLRTAVEHLGRKEVAYSLDVAGTYLSDAMNERDRKRWAAEWTHVVLAMLHSRRDDTSRGLMRQLAELGVSATPLVVDDSVEMTPEEQIAALRRELLALGDAGKAAVERVKRRAR
jgi:hypothetical protein